MAKQYSGWEIVTGQDFREVFILRDPTQPQIQNPDWTPCQPVEGKKIYPPYDLTLFNGKLDLRSGPNVTDALIKSLATGGAGMTFGQPDPVDGSVELFIDNTETKIAPFIDYKGKNIYYDFWLIPTTPGDDNIRVLFGTIPVIGNVTDV